MIQERCSGPSKIIQKPMAFDDFSKIQPLLFTFCSMLIRNGLKIGFRSLQERSKMPLDAQRPPTWGQHGPNMGPTWGPRGLQDRSRGGQIALPRGSPSQMAVRPPTWTQNGPKWKANGPQTDPKTKAPARNVIRDAKLVSGRVFLENKSPC